jgi:hypothetical protein
MASILRADILNTLVDSELETAIAAVQTKYNSQWDATDGTVNPTIDVQFAKQFRGEILKVMTRRLLRRNQRNATYSAQDAGRI